MSITFQLLFIVIAGFFVLNSVLTVIFGTMSWLVNKYRWKAWAIIGLLAVILGLLFYINLGDIVGEILTLIQ